MTIDYKQLAFIDTETTGLLADRHEIWEVGLIVGEQEYQWFLPVDLLRADPIALSIGGYHDRHPRGNNADTGQQVETVEKPSYVAQVVAQMTHGRHLVGAIPSFDEERLRKLMSVCGIVPSWHYHIIDVEALAVGWMHGAMTDAMAAHYDPPWDSRKLSKAIGVDPAQFAEHSALGDAQWAKAIYEKIMGDRS